jgi:hypothetical protein
MKKRTKDPKDVEPEIIDLTSASAPEPDPCVEAIAQSFPKLDPIARVGLYSQVLSMREFLHVRPKRRRGRAKGSGLMPHTLEAFELYKQGYTEGQIGRHFDLSKDELRKLMARIRAMKSRLPEEERRAFALAHWTGRSLARKPKAPTLASGSKNPRRSAAESKLP